MSPSIGTQRITLELTDSNMWYVHFKNMHHYFSSRRKKHTGTGKENAKQKSRNSDKMILFYDNYN